MRQSNFEDFFTVKLHFGNRVINVAQGFVPGGLLVLTHDGRIPTAHELFDRTHVNAAVVKEIFQTRHPACHEASILTDRVAAHRRLAGGYETRPMLKTNVRGFLFGDRAFENALG